jgi:hypothetical protein
MLLRCSDVSRRGIINASLLKAIVKISKVIVTHFILLFDEVIEVICTAFSLIHFSEIILFCAFWSLFVLSKGAFWSNCGIRNRFNDIRRGVTWRPSVVSSQL